jgi:hypothetical protein
MLDITTQKPLCVSTDGTAGPYIMVPLSQLTDVRDLLDQHDIRYTVEENAISFNGQPYIAVVNLSRGVHADEVQAILNHAA